MTVPSSTARRRRRRHRAATLITFLLLSVASPASADPAGPTDYLNEILDVTPWSEGVEFSVVGGDAFLRAEVRPGTELVIIGYFGEPYVRILPDGTVEENRNSPSVVLSTDRYGEDVEYDRATAQLSPEWQAVRNDGTWAWHDHRMHWMSRTPPPGRTAGDVVYDEVSIPVRIDGTETRVSISLTWIERPAAMWPVVGAALGLLLVAGTRRRPLVALGILAIAALVTGFWQYSWLPPETEPSFLQWAVPGVALLFVAAGARSPSAARIAAAVAAAELLAWGAWRREGMWRAILPTGAPWPLDRATTAACLAGGALALLLGMNDIRTRSRTPAEILPT